MLVVIPGEQQNSGSLDLGFHSNKMICGIKVEKHRFTAFTG